MVLVTSFAVKIFLVQSAKDSEGITSIRERKSAQRQQSVVVEREGGGRGGRERVLRQQGGEAPPIGVP